MKALLLAFLLAHSWYPFRCCHDDDCKQVPCGEVHVNSSGVGTYNGLTFKTVEISPDGQCHVCVLKSTNAPLCMFVGATT